MSYKPCFNGYNGINRSHKTFNRNIKRYQPFLYNVLAHNNIKLSKTLRFK